MSQSAGGHRFLTGFVNATLALGGLIVLAWIVIWLQARLGGPLEQMPVKLLASGASLILLGWVLKVFFMAQAKE